MISRVIIATLLVLTINFSKAGATDVYAMTERTSQGSIFEWYVRMDTYYCGKSEESVEIVRVGKDKWTRKSPPSVHTMWFWKAEGLWFFSTKDLQTQKQGFVGTVKDNALAKQVLKIVREYTIKRMIT